MAAPAPFTPRELSFLGALVDAGVDFMVVGLGAAALQGAPAITQAIDLWLKDLADPRFHSVLKKAGIRYIPPGPENPPLLVGAGAELFDLVAHMHGLNSFAEEAQGVRGVSIEGVTVPVLPLERIIASKKATNRPKDRAIVPVLEDCLEAIRSRSKRDRR